MTKLLLDEHPLVLQPSLAKLLGLHGAIVLQQINYWTKKDKAKEVDGYRWVYNSYADWHKQIPFLSDQQIGRAIRDLEAKGFLVSGVFNQKRNDRTKWYRVNHEKLEELKQSSFNSEQAMFTDERPEFTSEQPLPETNTETTAEEPLGVSVSLQPQEDEPEWYQVLQSIPGFHTPFNYAETWRRQKGISPELAELKAYALQDWWPRQPPGRTKNGNPYLTWQNWCRSDKDKTQGRNGNGKPGRHPETYRGEADRQPGESAEEYRTRRLAEQAERNRVREMSGGDVGQSSGSGGSPGLRTSVPLPGLRPPDR